MTKKPLELLAPAKNKDCAIAAINFGADAVYMGADLFGARKAASNSLDDIKDVVDYAHKFFVKVYITINTILSEGELNEVQNLLYKLYKVGVDGIIVQDFGIFELDLPPFKIFASTQCDTKDAKKVKFFENIGLDRVILARELSLEQIREISSKTDIEIETFVHGALCVSYSGQCYLSYALGGRSANRGECAQPCRKKYTLIDDKGKIIAKDKHLLCLKDFCLLPYLKDLIDAGVSSFKIEGRLKDTNYVKNVVSAYNLALQGYSRVSSGKVFCDFLPDVNKTFNRGYCSYFLNKDSKCGIFNFDTPKQIGLKLGVVTGVYKDSFEIKTDVKIEAQDGLCYFFENELSGMLVNKTEKTKNGLKIFPNKMPKITKGQTIFRNFDAGFEKTLQNSMTKRKIRADITILNEGIEAIDEDGVREFVGFDDSVQTAENIKKVCQVYIEQLKKSGGSDFYINDVKIKAQNLPFLKISLINALRRTLLENLMSARIQKYKKIQGNYARTKIKPSKFPLTDNDYRLNVHNSRAKEFYKKCGVECARMSYETKKCPDAELMRTKHCIRRAFNMCLKKCADKAPLYLIDEKGKKLKLVFDCKNCQMIIKE